MSTQTKFTPGPWRYVRENGSPTTGQHMISGAIPGYLAEVRDCGSGDVKANAHLIASAPDLYAALEALNAWHEWSHDQFEAAADEFYRDTGMLAPFKDVAAEAVEPSNMREIRNARWREWYSAKNELLINNARAALKRARGEG